MLLDASAYALIRMETVTGSGGGFVLVSVETHERLRREYVDAGTFVVVGVDFPLSPEDGYPVALDPIVALVD